MTVTPFNEGVRITQLFFNEVYGKTFICRPDFECFLIGIVRTNKLDGVKYKFSSVYFENEYSFIISIDVFADGYWTGMDVSFIFPNLRKDEDFNYKMNISSLRLFLGTPSYKYVPIAHRTSNYREERIVLI
jgi:hypothetical protein